MPRETDAAHISSKCLWGKPFRTEAASLMIVMAPMAWVSRMLLGLHVIVPSVVPSVYLRF
jgi:hypothetical protein